MKTGLEASGRNVPGGACRAGYRACGFSENLKKVCTVSCAKNGVRKPRHGMLTPSMKFKGINEIDSVAY
jgi:hypothetical protein